MIPLYLYLLIGSLIIPLLYSIFIKDFIKHWRNFLISTTIVALVFLLWDAIFTDLGIWSFNHDYCLNYFILKMPIEEWLFFYIIPFCSLFTHFAIFSVFPKLCLGKKTSQLLSLLFITISFLLIVFNYSKAYTVVDSILLIITLSFATINHSKLLQQFYISFLIILIPFFLVNGALTGMITESPIVSYNNAENLGIRLITIPIEDIAYAFTMLMGNLMIFDTLNGKSINKKNVSLSQ